MFEEETLCPLCGGVVVNNTCSACGNIVQETTNDEEEFTCPVCKMPESKCLCGE